MEEEYNTHLPDHSVVTKGPYSGHDCVLVSAAQLDGGRSSVAWAVDYEYARDGEVPAASVIAVIANGISEEETIRVVRVTDGPGTPGRVPTETVRVIMVDNNGCSARNRSILVRWVHPPQ